MHQALNERVEKVLIAADLHLTDNRGPIGGITSKTSNIGVCPARNGMPPQLERLA